MSFRISRTTSDEAIENATKEQLLEALFTGRFAVLRSSKQRLPKEQLVEHALRYRASLEAEHLQKQARQVETEAAETAKEANRLVSQRSPTKPATKSAEVAKTKIIKKDGEFIVQAFDAKGARLPKADYFTDDAADAEATARMMTKPAGRAAPKKFKSFAEAFALAEQGDEAVQRAIIGCLNNLGCDHLAKARRREPIKWKRYYFGLVQDYIGSLVGEYGESETKAEREVLAELNEARTYSDDVSLVDPPPAGLNPVPVEAILE